jgi:hypothetical protein
MQQQLDPKLVGKERGAVSRKTPERIYHVLFWGLMQSLRAKGWEVSIEPRAGGGYIDIRLRHRRKHMAILIVLKSSEKQGDMERDANKALKQIEEKNYRNPDERFDNNPSRRLLTTPSESCLKNPQPKSTSPWNQPLQPT